MAPRGQEGIPIEDLHRAIAAMKENDMELIIATTGLRFNQEVRETRLPEGFKLLAIKAYDKKYMTKNITPKTTLTTSMTSWNYTWFQNWQNAKFLLSL